MFPGRNLLNKEVPFFRPNRIFPPPVAFPLQFLRSTSKNLREMREILIKGKPFSDYLFKFLSSVQLNESYNEDFMPFSRIENE